MSGKLNERESMKTLLDDKADRIMNRLKLWDGLVLDSLGKSRVNLSPSPDQMDSRVQRKNRFSGYQRRVWHYL